MLRKLSLSAMLVTFIFSSFAFSASDDLEGTYRLVLRKLNDGTRISAPDVAGLMTFTKTDRNYNVVYKDKNGEVHSYSLISKYELTDKDYTERVVYSLLNEGGGKEASYKMEEESVTVPVKKVEGKLEFKMPFEPVTVTFHGDRIVAKNDNYTDYWEKIEE
jgi:hypothetical protein